MTRPLTETETRVLAALGESSLTARQISRCSGLLPGDVYAALRGLLSSDVVKPDGYHLKRTAYRRVA